MGVSKIIFAQVNPNGFFVRLNVLPDF